MKIFALALVGLIGSIGAAQEVPADFANSNSNAVAAPTSKPYSLKLGNLADSPSLMPSIKLPAPFDDAVTTPDQTTVATPARGLESKLIVKAPAADVDYKLIIQAPDPRIDYKLRIKEVAAAPLKK